MRTLKSLFALLLLTLASSSYAVDDRHALQGLDEAKGIFLVDLAQPQKIAMYLEIIAGSHAGMKRQGVEPDFVVVYIGPTVPYLSSTPGDQIEMEYPKELERIQNAVAKLDQLGIRQEVCAIATRVFGVDNATLLPGLSLVGDGFISLIGYQSQGYKLVPIY